MDTESQNKEARIRRLNDAATELMKGDRGAAQQWLRTPLSALDNETPLAHADSEFRTKKVENLVGRVRHGVFG